MERIFTDHPRTTEESYFQHFVRTAGFAGLLCLAALSCLVHAIFPFLLQGTASSIVTRLGQRMLAVRRRRRCPPELLDGGALGLPD